MSTLSKFLRRLSPEMLGMGRALITLASGVALQGAERRQVEEAANQFIDGAKNIEASLKSLKDVTPSFTQKQLNDAVRAALPDVIGGLSEAALRALLEKKTTPAT